ncbi:MAG: selenide, water dikinase SelD [Verrucomicrobiales bacterium]
MMTAAPSIPISREVVLVGGGHSHALVMRMLGMRPWPGVQVTLVSDVSHAPYSGMVPGHLAGVYSWEETHIDLRRLCAWAGARFVRARVTGLDLERRRVILQDRPPLAFEVVSINVGSTPTMANVPGAAEHAIPAKPVPGFLAAWESVCQKAARRTQRVVVVGGGAGGVEVALAVKARLGRSGEVFLAHQGEKILPTHADGVRRRVMTALDKAGVNLQTGCAVASVEAAGLVLDDGRRVEADAVLWTTQASAPAWLGASGLEVDEAGFVVVEETLRSPSHSWVFAAGDCATVRTAPRQKSGVFAVRAARPLLANLERHLTGRPLRRWKPQARFLSLIGTADGRAVVSRGAWAASGAWAWRWKDRIDRAFMEKFSELPAMDASRHRRSKPSTRQAPSDLARHATMRCLGCGGKVGGPVLHRVLTRLRASHPSVVSVPAERSDILAGLNAPDDAAVFTPPPGRCVVQTTDHLSALVDDPFVFGRLATVHAMSDILAMGAEPHSALVTALVPFAAEAVTEEWLTQALDGVATELARFGALLLGGHTAEAPAPALGLTCNGLAEPDSLWTKSSLAPGQQLILTKPLGTGTLFAAAMRQAAQGRWLDAAIDSMLAANQSAARLARSHGVTAATDITGFGLLGHLLEMLRPARLTAHLHLDALPVLAGAAETARLGHLSSLHPENARALESVTHTDRFTHHPNLPLLCDPQTSGGLLLALPPERAAALLAALHQNGVPHARIIGRVTDHAAAAGVTLE